MYPAGTEEDSVGLIHGLQYDGRPRALEFRECERYSQEYAHFSSGGSKISYTEEQRHLF